MRYIKPLFGVISRNNDTRMMFRVGLGDISQTVTRATLKPEIPSACQISIQHQTVHAPQMEVNAPSNAGECSNTLQIRCFDEQKRLSTKTVGVKDYLHVYSGGCVFTNRKGQSPLRTIRILNKSVLLIWSKFGDPRLKGWRVLAFGKSRNWHKHTQTKAMTIHEGQKWPGVKKSVALDEMV